MFLEKSMVWFNPPPPQSHTADLDSKVKIELKAKKSALDLNLQYLFRVFDLFIIALPSFLCQRRYSIYSYLPFVYWYMSIEWKPTQCGKDGIHSVIWIIHFPFKRSGSKAQRSPLGLNSFYIAYLLSVGFESMNKKTTVLARDNDW